jgi:hypothetical protein|eukprot:TRINITY_DN3192_c0_g1_i2.p1 TRINITY_DN3192_c0_g1~~TRINITY_DN3192_c0_g1_i2.p1  ORF type:complete len:258 (-),score=15.92 TRINITY_DN3192_c0_g1_i2:154-927(-)
MGEWKGHFFPGMVFLSLGLAFVKRSRQRDQAGHRLLLWNGWFSLVMLIYGGIHIGLELAWPRGWPSKFFVHRIHHATWVSSYGFFGACDLAERFGYLKSGSSAMTFVLATLVEVILLMGHPSPIIMENTLHNIMNWANFAIVPCAMKWLVTDHWAWFVAFSLGLGFKGTLFICIGVVVYPQQIPGADVDSWKDYNIFLEATTDDAHHEQTMWAHLIAVFNMIFWFIVGGLCTHRNVVRVNDYKAAGDAAGDIVGAPP